MRLIPKDQTLAGTLTEVRAGRFSNQRACEALRDDLAGQQPEFKRGLDVIEDLRELLAQEAASQAAPPAPAPAVTEPRPSAPKVVSPEEALYGEYVTAQGDPKAFSALLNHPEKGPRLRALAMSNQVPDGQFAERTPAPVNDQQPVTAELLQLASNPVPLADLAAVHERVKNSPVALARFLETNREALRDLFLVEA